MMASSDCNADANRIVQLQVRCHWRMKAGTNTNALVLRISTNGGGTNDAAKHRKTTPVEWSRSRSSVDGLEKHAPLHNLSIFQAATPACTAGAGAGGSATAPAPAAAVAKRPQLTRLGQHEEALRMYAKTREEGGNQSSTSTLLVALKACGSLGHLETGNQIHAHMLEMPDMLEGGKGHQVLLANSLMDMYVKCGCLDRARLVFDSMSHRSVVSWNVIILGYAKKEADMALELYARMQQQGFTPNDRTFVAALKACGALTPLEEARLVGGNMVKVGCLEKGRALHSHLLKAGYQSDMFVANTLVAMYAKCGSMADAHHVFFNGLPHRDLVSWNAMILGYADNHHPEAALHLYAYMQQEGVAPNDRTFVGAFKACGSLAALEEGAQILGNLVKMHCLGKVRAIHSQLLRSGCESDPFPFPFVGTALIDAYVKCGSMLDASHVFDILPHRDVVAWSAIILGYAQNRQPAAALKLYASMQRQGVAPDERTFVGALKACSSLAMLQEGAQARAKCVKLWCLEKGKSIHSRVIDSGFHSDLFLGTALVDMHSKCGSMHDAHSVFDNLPHRDVVVWNAMIMGYAEKEGSELDLTLALRLYSQLQEEGVAPNDVTFVAALKACTSLAMLEEGTEIDGKVVKAGSLEKGRALHARVVKSGFESTSFVGNTLIDMYAKCGSMADAQHVFHRMPCSDVASWNAIIFGCFRNGHNTNRNMAELELELPLPLPLQLYVQMQQQGVTPNDRTFVAALKACSSLTALEDGMKASDRFSVNLQSLEKGRSIHSHLLQSGFESDVYVATALVDMYAKGGSTVDARAVFDNLPHANVACWNAMIVGYAEQGDGESALQLYAKMLQTSIAPDDRTFVAALQACSSLAVLQHEKREECLEMGRGIHSQLAAAGFHSNLFVGNTLIALYAECCGNMIDAQLVFDELPGRDVVSWNAMIMGYAQKQACEVALRLYTHMLQEGVEPTDRTFVAVLKACSSLAALEDGNEGDGGHLKRGCLNKGRAIHSQVVSSGFESDAFVGATLVHMYAKCGSTRDARCVFDNFLHRRNVVCWNAMIMGYVEQGETERAFKLYAQMQEDEEDLVSADTWTFVGMLKACGKAAALERGKEIHAHICGSGLESSAIVATALVDMYGKCGSMGDAQLLFHRLATRDVATWNALIAGYARQGGSKHVFCLFERMGWEGIQADGVTFISLLTACSHVGLVDKGHEYFEAMRPVYGIAAGVEHYLCMVDLLGRAGQVEESVAMVESMPFEPDLVSWRTVLASCQKWNNVEIGRRAFECALRLDDKHAAAYVLMANIYADAHMWQERDFILAMKTKACAWKQRGESWWTDIHGIMHTFEVGDTKHPQTKGIHAKLTALSSQMKEGKAAGGLQEAATG